MVHRTRKRHVDSELQRRFEEIALGGYRAGLLPEPSFEYPVQLPIVPITGAQLRDPPRLVALMARIIEAARARRC